MSIKYNGCDDYGFLTCRPIDGRNSTINPRDDNDVTKTSCQAPLEQSATTTKTTQNNKQETLRKGDKKSKAEQAAKKKRWWRSIFSAGTKRKEKEKVGDGKAAVARHQSDVGCGNRSVLGQKRVEGRCNAKQKHRSEIFSEDSVIIVDERSLNEAKDPSLKVEINDFHERSKLRSAIRKSVSFSDVTPLHMHKSVSMDCIESLRQQNNFPAISGGFVRTLDVKCTAEKPHADECVSVAPASVDKKSSLTETSAKAQERKTKPVKPARSKLKNEQAKNTTSSSADDLLDQRMESKSQPPVLRRSRSMLSFKNLFVRKSKADDKSKKRRAVSTNMEILLQADVDNISVATSRDKVDSRKQDEINVYERYPRRKSEQRKVLVHIQTKEEIPIENGVPQWDSSSYQYSCLSGRGVTNRKEETTSTKPKPKLIESSFVGTRQQPNQGQTTLEKRDAPKPIATPARSTNPVKIVSLKNEPKNLELDRRRRTRSDGVLLDGISKIETELIDPLKKGEQEETEVPSKPNFHAKSSSCCEDLPFGRTFVLTGVATDKIPDVIARNYPYISTSSPVRHMAQCLRLATGIPKKSSPTRVKLFEDLSPSSEQPQHTEDSAQSSENFPANGAAPPSAILPASKPQPSPIKQVGPSPYQPRRCFSDSDLSSIHLSPMKISDKYKSDDKVNTSRRVSRSRSARTDRLLHRMRTRILRLEKLSDLAGNQHDQDAPIVSDVSRKHENTPISDQYKKDITTKNKVSTLENIMLKSDAASTTNPMTSSRKFHRLIKSRVQNRGDNPSYDRVAGLQHIKKSFQERNKTEPKAEKRDGNYENLWPDDGLSESKVNNEILRAAPTEREVVENVRMIQQDTHVGAEQTANHLLDRTLRKSAFNPKGVKSSQNEIDTLDATQQEIAAKRQVGLGSGESLVENLPKKQSEVVSDVISPHDIFLSSTPVKNYELHAAHANKNADKVFDSSIEEVEQVASQTSALEEDAASRDDLSPNPSVIPSASDYFLRSLIQHQDEIKRTMLQEMQKISHKYSASTTSETLKVPTNSSPFVASRSGEDDEQSSESDSTSQGTVTWGKERDSVSSGDTITNFCETEEDGYATMSSNDSTAAQCGSIISSGASTPQPRYTDRRPYSAKCPTAVEYVIPFRRGDVIEEASDFMEWDCDETDL